MDSMHSSRAANTVANSSAMKWSALLDAGAILAELAGVKPSPQCAAAKRFPMDLRDAVGWRRGAMENALSDLSAVMEPGISALLAVLARGADARPAAGALWAEFDQARNALLALAPVAGPGGPRRSA